MKVEILTNIKMWLSAKRKAHRERKAAQKAAALVRESEAIVQAREFSGEVYVCFNNVPILPADGLTWDVPTTLAVAREAWLKWKEKEAEYEVMCKEMERVAGYDERRAALLKAKRKARSGVLHQMQLWGVNTADWKAVDRFCEDKRIAGKAFRFLDSEELATLNTKLRAMNRKKNENE